MGDLDSYLDLVSDIVNDLSNIRQRKNYEHYDSTIKRLIENMMITEPEENDNEATTKDAKVH